MKDVRMLSQNRLRLGTGTLYGALKRLLDLGWILRVEENEHSTARSRKLYQLTLLGRSILTAEIHRLEGLVSAAQLRSTKVAPTLDGLS
jgi:DNA-binding PadR family transcriptional regulator